MKGAPLMDPYPPEGSSGDIVTLLLEKNSSAACFRNSNGLTPLLVAVSCKTPYLLAIKSILNYCPQCIEVCDFSGKTMLHLLSELSFENELPPEGGFFEYLLSIPEIHFLKNYQDLEGNTPAHMAVKNQNILMVGLLLQLSTNFAIKNKDGLSAANLIQPNIDNFKDLPTSEGYDLYIPCTRIEGEKERLEMLISELQQRGVEIMFNYTLLQQKGNVLHMLIDLSPWDFFIWEGEVQEFIKQVLDTCPALICETDRDGRTPLHNIAGFFPEFIDESVLKMFSHYFKKLEDESSVRRLYLPPWTIQDCDGNTPLHCALISCDLAKIGSDLAKIGMRCLREFLKLDKELVKYQNDSLQTPLHLLLADDDVSSEWLTELENFELRGSIFKACELRDKDGLTPLLKAAKNNLLPHVRLLYTLSPLSVYERTDDGKTFWHLLASGKSLESNHENLEQFLNFFKQKFFFLLSPSIADYDGNTALHQAIKSNNFRFARFLIERVPESLLHPNQNGLSPADLIASAEHIPRHFNEFLWSKLEIVKDLMVVRSLSGVSTSKIENYTNTIGVIAALLATVTFTAAFTVPGGLDTNSVPGGSDTNTGTPLLLKKTAFQVFMVSDVVAMCLSMMVLFCLRWIITMSNKQESVVLLDLSIFLLEASFYATLLAFMTGLYVTTYHITPWVGILSCALCSSLILLMHKRFFAFSIPCFIRTFSVSQKAVSLLSNFLHLLPCGIPKSAMGRSQHVQSNEKNEGGSSSIGHGTSDALDNPEVEQIVQSQPNWRTDYF